MLLVRPSVVRAYADTSVYGGAFDPGFEAASRAFLERAQAGSIQLVTSALVKPELAEAPAHVREFATDVLARAEEASATAEVLDLHAAYMAARIVAPRRAADSLHVAIASVAGCPILVSWNFRHIVHYRKIPQYNAINAIYGYRSIAIHSPPEVGTDADRGA